MFKSTLSAHITLLRGTLNQTITQVYGFYEEVYVNMAIKSDIAEVFDYLNLAAGHICVHGGLSPNTLDQMYIG